MSESNNQFDIENDATVPNTPLETDEEFDGDSSWSPASLSSTDGHVFQSNVMDTEFDFGSEEDYACVKSIFNRLTILKVDWEEKCFRLVCTCVDCNSEIVPNRYSRPVYYLTNSDGLTYISTRSAFLYQKINNE